MPEWDELSPDAQTAVLLSVAVCVVYAAYRGLTFAFSYLVAWALLKVVMPWAAKWLPALLEDYGRMKNVTVREFAQRIRPF